MQKFIFTAALGCLALFTMSCVSVEPVRERAQLEQFDSSATLSLLTKDGTIYHLSRYESAGDEIHGSGTREFAGRTLPFTGALAFPDIEYAQVERENGGGTIAAVATAAIIAGAVAAGMVAGTKREKKPYPREGEQ